MNVLIIFLSIVLAIFVIVAIVLTVLIIRLSRDISKTSQILLQLLATSMMHRL